jgi:hypothetical protein
MMEDLNTTELPEALQSYFWDYDAASLSWESSRHTIVLRLIQSCGMDGVQWLRTMMTDAELRDFLLRRRGRGLSPRRLRFWALIVGLPQDQVDMWIAAARSNPWAQRISS